MHNLALALAHKGYRITGSDDVIFEPSKSRLQNFFTSSLKIKLGWLLEVVMVKPLLLLWGQSGFARTWV